MKKWTKETLFDLKNVSQPKTNGNQVFYLETQIDREENKYETTLHSVDVRTKSRKKWGDNGTVQTALQVSPNGKWISYLSNDTKDEKMQVMVMPTDGGSAVQLTHEDSVSSYHWTANSAAIYIQTSSENKKEEPTEEKVKDKKEKKQPMPIVIDKLQYKMDGRGMLPQNRTYTVKKVSLASKQTEEILSLDRPVSVQYVSKDESFLIIADKLDIEDEWKYGGTVYWYDVASKSMRSLTMSIPDGSFGFGAMSDKEDYILLVGNDFEFAFVTQNKLFGYDVSKQELVCLTQEKDIEISDVIVGDFQQQVTGVGIEWLSDEDYLFPVTEDGKLQLYKGNRKGEVACIFNQRVHLTDAALMEDKTKVAVSYSTPTKPSELAILDLNTQKLTALYNPNEAFEKEHVFNEPEMFWYKGADDWEIQGWYMPPIHKKDKHPAILYVHGGPQVCYGETFFHEMHIHAENGYGVLMLNPRGGNGYGQEFVKSILGDYGNKDFEDLMLGLDDVLHTHPEIDENELFVVGGSYGGFMTNWAVTHTDRFKRAVTQRSISNWISFYGTSDVGAFFVEFQLQRDLSDWEGLWKLSPLAYAENAKTPLLVIHSEQDLRCPQEQGEQFYVAMKKHHVETKMVLFPESNHGLSREGLPNLRMERIQHISDWLAK